MGAAPAVPAASDDLPEPFASAIARGRVGDVVDQDATTPAGHLARARARTSAGRFDEAREDLDRAEPKMGDAARIERAWLDLRQRGALREALRTARDIAKRAGDNVRLRARALHVLGHAQSRLRRSRRAVTTLLEAREGYLRAGDERGVSHVNDSIGQVYAAHGDLEQALFFYSLSLVDKASLGDRLGMAVTIGNIGRIQLRAGHFRDAISCFERDLAISIEVGDVRGQARMLEDLGRACAGLEDDVRAEKAFAACLELAEAHGFVELVFYAHLDLAALKLRQGRLDEAAASIDAACATGLDRETPFFAMILEAARGELLLAQDAPDAVDVLDRALRRLERADLPDVEIPARLRLARAFREHGLKALAERTLLRGVRRARRGGYTRYLPALNEAMTELRVVEGVLDETGRGRRAEDDPDEPADGAYVILAHLGDGAYGEVYRAYDPRRAREVALKLVHLERVYDLGARRRMIDSLRVELEAASRVRHPGVARVFAIGREEDGGLYVVQEYVQGHSLRTHMNEKPEPAVGQVATVGARLAYALQALHDAGVVHRDLKPENVLIRTDGTPVVVDFGIAHVPFGEIESVLGAGTLEYMAPEQALGRRVDGRSDLYALGVILFEWLVGFRPLQIQDRNPARWEEILEEEVPPRVRELRPDVPQVLDDLVASLLAKRRADRPPDAATVAWTLAPLRV